MHIQLTDEEVEQVRTMLKELDDNRTNPLTWIDFETWVERFLREMLKEAECQPKSS